MDVALYVYDLSDGLARQMSMQLLGTQIDAVYHTSLAISDVEYFFGAGVQMCNAGQSHHGRPMEIIPLGQTALPEDLILDYLNSLKEIYTPESYDLFMHNCNNFSNDFAMFLVGKGIPDHIKSLPRRVLETPFGQMMKPQLDRSIRSVTQAPVPAQARPDGAAPRALPHGNINRRSAHATPGKQVNDPSTGFVHDTTSLSDVEALIQGFPSAIVFFTSVTCPPCKLVYPTFDELATEAGDRCVLIKVDISTPGGQPIAAKYKIRATPTFLTFLKGVKQDTWSGANPAQLRGNVRLLIQMAFPPHPHEGLTLPQFHRQSQNPVFYGKIPPLEKLTGKLGEHQQRARGAVDFIAQRNEKGANEAPLPDLTILGTFFRESVKLLPPEVLFASYDLLRLMLVDERVSSFFGQEGTTIKQLIGHVIERGACPYSLRLVSIHMTCNLFSSSTARHSLLSSAYTTLTSHITTLITDSLLDPDHSNLRVAAATLAFNLATTEYIVSIGNEKDQNSSSLSNHIKVELAAALIEAIKNETESVGAVHAMIIALGRLVYKTPVDGELFETCLALEAGPVLLDKVKFVSNHDKELMLLREVGGKLLKGV